MKKVVTLDAVMVSFIAAMGYGFGYTVPSAFGWHPLLCLVVCLALGSVLDSLANRIVFSSAVQKTTGRRYLVFLAIALVFLAGYAVLARFFAYSLWNDVGSELTFSVVLPVVFFFLSLLIRAYKQKKLLAKYGTGESGFRFDEKAAEHWMQNFGVNAVLSEADRKLAVRTVGGTYVGKKTGEGIRFLGIPYARAERWKKPVPVAASEQICEAYYFGNSEIQPDNSHNILSGAPQGEDCLSLNIWTAKLEPEAGKPVFVYFHGGDGRYGGSAGPSYSLGKLAGMTEDGVFVSFNYRFGILGVVDFSASGCPDAAEYEESTALSLLDQIEALKWIRANIAAFGGDPENVTVAGDGSGGSCICLLAAMKEAKGLFRRALILCASVTDTPADDKMAALAGKNLLAEFPADTVFARTAVTAEELRDFSLRNYQLLELPPRNGKLVPQNVDEAFLSGVASDIEWIFGIAADDASGWQAMLAGDPSLNNMIETYYETLRSALGPEKAAEMDSLLSGYGKPDRTVTEAKRALLSDFHYKACMLHDCRTLARGGSRVHCFFWDVDGNIEKLTANSVSLVTAILGNAEAAEQMGYLHDWSLTEILQMLLGKYIRGQGMELYNNELKGVPGFVWAEFSAEEENILHIRKDAIRMSGSVFSDRIRELENLAFASDK